MATIGFSGYLLQLFGRKKVLFGASLLTCLAQLTVAAFFQFEVSASSRQASQNVL